MKKILVAVGLLLVVTVGAILTLPALIPADRIKNEVVAQVKSATGRDLAIDGKVSVSVLPSLSVQVANVALSNPPGYSSKDMVRLGALDVNLKLLPILSGSIEIDSFVLIDPVIVLETDRKGRPNWEFGTAPAAKPEAKPGQTPAAAPTDIKLGEIAIRNGKLVYIDGVANTREEVTDIALAVALPSLDQPLGAEGAVKWRGQAMALTIDIANPRAVAEGKASPAAIALDSQPVKLTFKGDAGASGSKGAIDLTIPSVRELVKWATGKPLDMPGSGLGPFALKGDLSAQGTKVALANAIIALDAIKATGDFAVNTGGARPDIKGRLAVESLDLNPYLPADTAKPATPAAAAGKSDWSDAPLDASGLKTADVDFQLTVGAIKVRAIDIGKSVLHLAIANGRMNADLTELNLYQGSGKGRLTVNGSQPGLGVDASFTLGGLQAQPFLAAAAGFDRLEGTGSAEFRLSGQGRTERQLVSSLNGNGGVSFLDGAIKGINLAAMVRNVTTAFTDTSGNQKTDFAELAGTYSIANGIVTNKDLALKSPLLRVEGAGTVDLPRRALKYRIEPKAVATIEGQGGQGDLAGIEVPVIIEGPWDALAYRPDLEAMAKGQATKAVEGLLKGGGDGSKPALPMSLPGALFGR